MAHPRLTYQLFFDRQTPEAVAELNRDIRRTLRGTVRDVASPPPESFLTSSETFIGAWDHVDEVCLLFFRRWKFSGTRVDLCFQVPPIPFFSEEEEDYWVEQYGINGFDHSESSPPLKGYQ